MRVKNRFKYFKVRMRRRARSFEKRYREHPRLVPILAAVMIFGICALLLVTLRDSASISSRPNANIVILHHDNLERVVPTRETTVSGFLDKVGIEINEGDVIEPSLDTTIDTDEFRVNIYRGKPVVVVDQEQRTFSFSAATTPRSVVQQVGLDVYPEDIIEQTPSEDFINDGIGSKVEIIRSTPANLNLYGTQLSLRTHAKTVGELLAEKNVVLGDSDTVKPALNSALTENVEVFVTRFGVQVVSVEEVIPKPVEKIEDANLSYGTTAVRQKGRDGKKSVTYELELKNGKEVSRKLIQEVVTEEPVKEIVAVGVGGRFENFNADGIPARVFCGSPRQGNWKNINVSNAALGRAMAEAQGWTGGQFTALLELFACESSWNERAGNPYSGAYGIPQSWPAEKMSDPNACGGAGYLTDPQIQISWGICYIQRRYGTPRAALDFHYRNNFY